MQDTLTPPRRGPGRPRKPDALTDKERSRRYRLRQKAKLAALAELAAANRPPLSRPVVTPPVPAPWKPWRAGWMAFTALTSECLSWFKTWVAACTADPGEESQPFRPGIIDLRQKGRK